MSDLDYSIHKAAGIIIQNRKLLVEKSIGKKFFVAPGGKLEEGESSEAALIRELDEEIGIKTKNSDFEILNTYYAQAANSPEKRLRMDVYFVNSWEGKINPLENQEIVWVESKNIDNLPIGSIFEDYVIPLLKKEDLID